MITCEYNVKLGLKDRRQYKYKIRSKSKRIVLKLLKSLKKDGFKVSYSFVRCWVNNKRRVGYIEIRGVKND